MTEQVDQRAATPRSARKRAQILDAARELFLENGYLGTNVDEIAARSQVSKPTVYSHFGSKKGLFVEIVSSMTGAAADGVHRPALGPGEDLEGHLRAVLGRQLEIVLDPVLLRLRRLVIAEVSRFPELAAALYAGGPGRAVGELARVLRACDENGTLRVEDPERAAASLNWLVMGAPVNDAMLLGDDAIMPAEEQPAHVAEAVRIFLAAYRPG